MFKYSMAIIAALAFMGMGVGCSNISSRTFRPRTVEVFTSGGQTDFREKGPGSVTSSSSSHGKHNHSSSSTRTGRKTTGRYDSWSLGAGIGWQIIYKDEEAARDRNR